MSKKKTKKLKRREGRERRIEEKWDAKKAPPKDREFLTPVDKL